MLIRDWMSRSVITLDIDDPLTRAINLFRTKMVSMLPVLENGKLAGIITGGDLKKAALPDTTPADEFEKTTEKTSLINFVKIKYVMSRPVVTIPENHTVDEASEIMLKKQISGMPVLDGAGNLEGIITKSDVFRCLVSFTGISNKGQIFAFKLTDRPGVIKMLTDIIRTAGGRMCSILTSYDDVEQGFRKVFFHTFDIDPSLFDSLVERLHKTGELLYVADLSRGFRKIC